MCIAGKLFGFVGQVTSETAGASPRCSETACPGFGWWYSLQMAKSYEFAARRTSGKVVQLIGEAKRRDLSLAA